MKEGISRFAVRRLNLREPKRSWKNPQKNEKKLKRNRKNHKETERMKKKEKGK